MTITKVFSVPVLFVVAIIAMVISFFTPLIQVIYGIPLAVIAAIMVVGIGGNYVFGGNIPFFGINVPCIAGAAIFGIFLNLLLSIGEKKNANTDETVKEN